MKKKYNLKYILFNFFIAIISIFNSFIGLLINILGIIFFKNVGKSSYLLLILNFSLINLYRIPHSDYYRYFTRYYNLQNLSVQEFKVHLLKKEDYLFYISKYIFSSNGYSFFLWAFFYSLLIYVIIYLISLKIKNDKYRVYVFLLINPFNITRFVGAMVLGTYAVLSMDIIKKNIFMIFSWLTHNFFVVSYLINFIKKKNFKLKIYSFIFSGILISTTLILFKIELINILKNYIKIGESYYNLENENFNLSLSSIRGSIDQILNLIIIILLLFDKKLKGFIRVNIIIVLPFYFIAKIIFTRYLNIIIFLGVILCFMENRISNKKRMIIIMIIIIKQLINFQDNIRYGIKTNTYPVKERILSKDEVLKYLNIDGGIK